MQELDHESLFMLFVWGSYTLQSMMEIIRKHTLNNESPIQKPQSSVT